LFDTKLCNRQWGRKDLKGKTKASKCILPSTINNACIPSLGDPLIHPLLTLPAWETGYVARRHVGRIRDEGFLRVTHRMMDEMQRGIYE